MEELLWAIEMNDYYKVKNLLSTGANLNQTVKHNPVIYTISQPPVVFAALLHRSEIVDLLLKCGADVNYPDEVGNTALHCALHLHSHQRASACYDTVEILLNNGADITLENINGHTPLYIAVMTGELRNFKFFMAFRPDLYAKGNQEVFVVALKCPYFPANRYGRSYDEDDEIDEDDYQEFKEVTKSSYDYGFSLPVDQLVNDNSFIIDVYLELYKTFEDFLSQRAILNMTSLMIGLELALNDKYIALIEMIHKYCPDVLSIENSNHYKGIPFFRVASYLHHSVVELLIKLGADVNWTDYQGDTPLINAVRYNKITVIEALLKAGADVNKLSHEGKPPTYYSIQRCMAVRYEVETKEGKMRDLIVEEKNDVLSLLIKSGADVHWRGTYDETLLHVLCNKGSVSSLDADAVKILSDAGLDVDARDNKGETALHKAVRRNNFSTNQLGLVDSLINAGANINLPSNDNLTPIDVADDHMFSNLKDHLIRMIVAGLIDASKPKFIHLAEDISKNSLEQELRMMELTNIAENRITYRDFLYFNRYQLARCLENVNILQELEAGVFKTKFPAYSRILTIRLLVGKRRMDFMKLGRQIITSISGSVAVPDVCLDKILSYLSPYDLRKINCLV